MEINIESEIERAVKALRSGNLVAFPTETVYGLGADALNFSAVMRLFRIKERPLNHPLIVHISNSDNLDFWIEKRTTTIDELLRNFTPGPLTIIFNKKSNLKIGYLTGNQEKIAIRIPKHPITKKLLSVFEQQGGRGVVAPSANKFGKVSNTSPQGVYEDFQTDFLPEDVVLDGGMCEIGIESTILDCSSKVPKLLRLGSISQEEIQKTIGSPIDVFNGEHSDSLIKFSGMFARHYAPNAKVVWQGVPQIGDGYLGLASNLIPKGVHVLALPKDSIEFARILYQCFRTADRLNLKRIFVSIPKSGKLASAIEDRVIKASN